MKTIQVRLSEALKISTEQVLEDIGIDMPTAIRLYCKKISHTKSIPFALTVAGGHEFTAQELKEIEKRERETRQGKNLSPSFSSSQEAIKYLKPSI